MRNSRIELTEHLEQVLSQVRRVMIRGGMGSL